jgi:hypothetical protein
MKGRYGIFAWFKTLFFGTILLFFICLIYMGFDCDDDFIYFILIEFIIAGVLSMPAIAVLLYEIYYIKMNFTSIKQARKILNWSHLLISILTFGTIGFFNSFHYLEFDSYLDEEALFIEACFFSYTAAGIYFWDRALVKNFEPLGKAKIIEKEMESFGNAKEF